MSLLPLATAADVVDVVVVDVDFLYESYEICFYSLWIYMVFVRCNTFAHTHPHIARQKCQCYYYDLSHTEFQTTLLMPNYTMEMVQHHRIRTAELNKL